MLSLSPAVNPVPAVTLVSDEVLSLPLGPGLESPVPQTHAFTPSSTPGPSDMYKNTHPHSNKKLPGGVAQRSERSELAFGVSFPKNSETCHDAGS